MNDRKENYESNCPFLEDIILTKRDVADMKQDISDIKKDLRDFIETADKKYVQKIEFLPIKKFVYGAVGTTLLAVLGAIFAVILK